MRVDDFARQQRRERRGERNAGGRPVLGHGAFGHVDVQVVILQHLRLFREQVFHQADRDAGGFLHHIAQLSGDDQLALAARKLRFHIEDLAAHRRPGKARDDAGRGFRQDLLVVDGPVLQLAFHQLRRHGNGFVRIRGHLHGQDPAQRVDPLAQPAYAGFHRIIRDQRLQRGVLKGQLRLVDAHGLHGLRHQMVFGDLQLLQRRIAGELDHLHAVQQRLGDGVGAVGGAEEQHVGQVVGNIHVMVGKGVVLLGVQYLQQGARGIAVVGRVELVHLVQHHHRVRHAALVDAVHDAAGHGPDVRAAVAANVRLVMHAAEAHAHILAAQRAGDALADAGLAGARRPHEEQDRAGLLLFQVHHGDLLDDAVLHLGEPVVVLVQDLPRLIQIDARGVLLLPGEAGHKVQIIVEDAGLHTLLALLLQAVQHLFGFPAGGVVHTGLGDLFLELLDVGHVFGVHLIQFLLQMLDLPLDGRLLVALLILLLLRRVGLIGDAGNFHVLVERFLNELGAFCLTVLGEDGITLLVGDVQHGRHDASGHAERVHLIDEVLRGLRPLQPGGILPHLLNERAELLPLFIGIQVVDVVAAGSHELDGVVGIDPHVLHVHAGLGTDGDVPLRVDLHDIAGDADMVEIVLRQIDEAFILLGHDQDHLLVNGDPAAAGAAAQLILRIEKGGVRGQYHIIGWNNDQIYSPLGKVPSVLSIEEQVLQHAHQLRKRILTGTVRAVAAGEEPHRREQHGAQVPVAVRAHHTARLIGVQQVEHMTAAFVLRHVLRQGRTAGTLLHEAEDLLVFAAERVISADDGLDQRTAVHGGVDTLHQVVIRRVGILPEHLGQHLFLAVVVHVDRGRGDACLPRDLGDRRAVDPFLQDQTHHGVLDPPLLVLVFDPHKVFTP